MMPSKFHIAALLACFVGIFGMQAQNLQKSIKLLKAKKYEEAAPALLAAENAHNRSTDCPLWAGAALSAPGKVPEPVKGGLPFP